MRTSLPCLLALALACGDDLRPGGGEAADSAPPGPDGGRPGDIERAQAGGAPTAVRLAGEIAYVAVGPRLTIWQGGAQLGESDPLGGVATDVALSGERVFVAEHTDLSGRVHVVDVSDPARPVETASFAVVDGGPTIPLGMAVVGDRLYVADQEQGIAEVDIADPDAPAVLRVVPPLGSTDLFVAGPRLYWVANSFIGGGVGALDLTSDLAPLGETSLFGAEGVAVTPDDLVVAAGVGGIQVVDLSDLDDPIERYRFTLPDEGPFARAVAVSRTRAWIPAADGVYVLNLSDPADIRKRGPFDLAIAGANATDVAGPLLAVVSDRGELHLVDVSRLQPAAGSRTAISLCSDCIGVFAAGDLLAIGDAAGGLRTASVVDLGLLGRSSELDQMVDFEDVALAGENAFAADWFFGLRVYQIGDPAAPALIGQVATAGFPSSVALAGDRAYVGEATNGGALRVIDVAVPAEPREIGAVATSQTKDVEVAGDLAYLAEGSFDLVGGLRIVGVSDPADLRVVGHYSDQCAEAVDLALTGSLAVVACSFDGFHVVDVSDPGNPVRRALVPAPDISSAWSVTAWEGGAALGHDRGVIVIDLADPAAPAIVEEHATSFAVRALAAPGDGRLIAGCGLGGVYQWALPPAR